jgi:poly-gamma-glutamate synthesis protein (capsule biosynthesis protein)
MGTRLCTILLVLASPLLFVGLCAGDAPIRPVTLAFAGDVLLAGLVGAMIQDRGTEYPLAEVAPILKTADLAFANLECALTGNAVGGRFHEGDRSWCSFTAPPRFGQALVDGGIDVVSLANNHTYDGGEKGLLETMATLDQFGIVHVGAGRDVEEARAWRVVRARERKIAFLAYDDIDLRRPAAAASRPGIALLRDTLPQVLEEVALAKQEADVVIVSFHWGALFGGITTPSDRQVLVAHQVIEAGADIVVGHHPHVLQPIEVYRGKTIAYSLGNFVFDHVLPERCQTVILLIEVTAKGKQQITKIPCRIENCRPRPHAPVNQP